MCEFLDIFSGDNRGWETEAKFIDLLRDYIIGNYYVDYPPRDGEHADYVFRVKVDNGAFVYTNAYSCVIEYMKSYPSVTTELVRVRIGGELHKKCFRNTFMWFAKQSLDYHRSALGGVGYTFMIGGVRQPLTYFEDWCSVMEKTYMD
jgi:hypothetical protein